MAHARLAGCALSSVAWLPAVAPRLDGSSCVRRAAPHWYDPPNVRHGTGVLQPRQLHHHPQRCARLCSHATGQILICVPEQTQSYPLLRNLPVIHDVPTMARHVPRACVNQSTTCRCCCSHSRVGPYAIVQAGPGYDSALPGCEAIQGLPSPLVAQPTPLYAPCMLPLLQPTSTHSLCFCGKCLRGSRRGRARRKWPLHTQ
jgi:hypothetical protein